MSEHEANSSGERIDVVRALMRAWSAHDVEGVLALVSDDVIWHYAVGLPPCLGKAAMGEFLTGLAGHQQELAWRLTNHAETNDRVLVEGVDDYVNPAGHRVQVPYMGAYDFDGDSITGWRDYVDMRTMRAAEKGGGVPEHLVALVEAGEPLS